MADKPLSELTTEELSALNKNLGEEIRRLQARKAEVVDAYAARQDTERAVAAVRSLGPHKRAALMRALEVQAAEEAKAAEAEKQKLSGVAAAVEEAEATAAAETKLAAVRAEDAAKVQAATQLKTGINAVEANKK